MSAAVCIIPTFSASSPTQSSNPSAWKMAWQNQEQERKSCNDAMAVPIVELPGRRKWKVLLIKTRFHIQLRTFWNITEKMNNSVSPKDEQYFRHELNIHLSHWQTGSSPSRWALPPPVWQGTLPTQCNKPYSMLLSKPLVKASPPGGCQGGIKAARETFKASLASMCAVLCPCQLPAARKGGETAALLSYLLLRFSMNTFKCQLFLPYIETNSDCNITPLTTESTFSLFNRNIVVFQEVFP